MKRFIVLAVALIVAAFSAVTGCSQSSAPPVTPAPGKTTAAVPPTLAAAVTPTPNSPAAGSKVSYPEKGKAINWIIPFAAGTSPDLGPRVLATGLEKELGTSVQITNKAGANGQTGYTEIARSKADGYTIGMVVLPGIATIMLDPERQAAFTRKSFQPLAMHVQEPSIFAVLKDSPFKGTKDVVDAAKAAPEKVKVATGGLLGDDNLAALYLQKVAGVKFAIVPMTEGRQAALLGGHVDVYVGKTGDLYSQIKSGEVRILGITGERESKFLPGVKTMKEQGYAFTSYASRGYVAPAGTPKEAVDTLSAAMKKVMTTEEHNQKMDEQALSVTYLDAAEFGRFWDEREPETKMLMELSQQSAGEKR